MDYVDENYCLDIDSIHMTGISNGGMYSYYAASRLNDILASIAPCSGMGGHPSDPTHDLKWSANELMNFIL